MADIGKTAIETKPKQNENAAITIKKGVSDSGKSDFDQEIDFDLPEMEANTDDGTAPTEIENRINKELGSGGISVYETAELVEYDKDKTNR